MKKYIITIVMVLGIIVHHAYAQTDTLHVYGPGGPLNAISECAKVFTGKTGIPVKVIGGPEPKWLSQAQLNGDVIYEGAEYMLTQFMQTHPEVTDPTTKTELYRRAAAILVRPGNPKGILSFKDLTKPGVKILDVNGAGQLGLWEDIAGQEDLIAAIQKNIGGSFANTALGIDAWKKDSSFDAWITYSSWHKNLKETTQLVPLPLPLRLYRGTPIAITKRTQQGNQAKRFVDFLKSKQGHVIFQKWGWE